MQLLKITRTPIKISVTAQRARLEMRQPTPEVAIQRTPSRLSLKSENIKVNIDTFEARNSAGRKTARALIADAAAAGVEAAGEATAQYAEIGSQMGQIHKGANLADIMYSKLLSPATAGLRLMPVAGPEITWQSNNLEIEYTPTELDFSATVMQNSMEYIPGQLQFNIEQYPSLSIEYLGEPIYAPPSANPNYKEE